MLQNKTSNCCEEKVFDPNCPCRDDIPNALPTESFVFDKNGEDETVVIEGIIDFKCCAGSNSIEIIKFNNKENLPVTFNGIGNITTDKTFSGELNFTAASATKEQVGSVEIVFKICEKEVTKLLNINIIDTCVDTYPISIDTVFDTVDIDKEDGAVKTTEINFPINCCDGNTIEVVNIKTPETETGVELLSPTVGQTFNGTTVSVVYRINTDNALLHFKDSLVIEFKVCGLYNVEYYQQFSVITSCSDTIPADLSNETLPIFYAAQGIQTYNLEKIINGLIECCPDRTARVQFLGLSPVPSSSGITVLSQSLVDAEFNFEFEYNPNNSTLGKGDSQNVEITATYKYCSGINKTFIITIPIVNDLPEVALCGNVNESKQVKPEGSTSSNTDAFEGTATETLNINPTNTYIAVLLDSFGIPDKAELRDVTNTIIDESTTNQASLPDNLHQADIGLSINNDPGCEPTDNCVGTIGFNILGGDFTGKDTVILNNIPACDCIPSGYAYAVQCDYTVENCGDTIIINDAEVVETLPGRFAFVKLFNLTGSGTHTITIGNVSGNRAIMVKDLSTNNVPKDILYYDNNTTQNVINVTTSGNNTVVAIMIGGPGRSNNPGLIKANNSLPYTIRISCGTES